MYIIMEKEYNEMDFWVYDIGIMNWNVFILYIDSS